MTPCQIQVTFRSDLDGVTNMVEPRYFDPKCEILLEGGSHFENFNFCSDFREQRKLGLKVIKSFTKEIEANKLKIPLHMLGGLVARE